MRVINMPTLNEINEQIAEIEQKLLYVPKGSFFVNRNGKYIRWRTGGGHTVPKRKRKYASSLCARKYYEARAGFLLKLKSVVQCYESLMDSQEKLQLDEFKSEPEYISLLSDYFGKKVESASSDWSKKEYDSNLLFPEEKKFHTISGTMVRSKSEMAIADALTRHGIPFRYECPMELNGTRIFPDFTVLSPRTKQEIVWEHFGMMDNKKYRQGVWLKLEEFANDGYIMGYDFIYTMESANHPLDDMIIEDMITRYLL